MRCTAVPKLIGELYYLELPAQGAPKARRLTPEGRFAESPLPPWLPAPRCGGLAMEHPSTLVVPVYETTTAESHEAAGMRVLRTFRWRSDRCFIARLDQTYLRSALFPQLLSRSFGETAMREYDFAVASLSRPGGLIYGVPVRADLRKTFFSILPLPPLSTLPSSSPQTARQTIVVQRSGAAVRGELADLFGPGVWELRVAHKGMPLTAAFERTRRRDLLLSLGVEALLVVSIVFLVIGARRMQRLADQRMRFVAGVSHELRTPVSAIAMLARNQADGLVTGAEKVKQYGELIHQECRRLGEMVEQTLQYAGIQSGRRPPAESGVDLRRLIEETVDARREELERLGFEVELALDPNVPPVPGDARLLRTALDNLLSNAAKHAGGGRWIRVSASCSAPDKEVRISVEDRGAGIPPADQAEIFEPFRRGRAAVEAQIPGSGLGLSLVRGAAKAHRGSVTLASEPGRGTTFTVHLPV
jgi:two-component system sensor histidine kinase SenX3